MSRSGIEELLAALVAGWFLTAGVLGLVIRPAQGRRALEPTALLISRRVRAILFILGALAVAAGAINEVLQLQLPFPGQEVGLTLAALSVWGALEALRSPIRWLRLALFSFGFALAVSYAAFRA